MGVPVTTDHHVPAIRGTVKENRAKSQVAAGIPFQNQLPDSVRWYREYCNRPGIRPGPGPGLDIAIECFLPTSLDQPLGQLRFQWYPQSLRQHQERRKSGGEKHRRIKPMTLVPH